MSAADPRLPGENARYGTRDFVQAALTKAKATTDEELRQQANAPAHDPGSIAKFSYAQGVRDGVAMACEQTLAFIDLEGEAAPELTVMRDLVHGSEECFYDHHDYCQAHHLDPRPCPYERAKKRLSAEGVAW